MTTTRRILRSVIPFVIAMGILAAVAHYGMPA